jgi:putative lipoic acid-binding regulatory protein
MWPPYPNIFADGDLSELPEARDEFALILAMEEAHEFPGYYPVIVIAQQGEDFRALLYQTLSVTQGQAPFEVTERPSRKGTYISYRIEIFVESARSALDRKLVISSLEGVLYLL